MSSVSQPRMQTSHSVRFAEEAESRETLIEEPASDELPLMKNVTDSNVAINFGEKQKPVRKGRHGS